VVIKSYKLLDISVVTNVVTVKDDAQLSFDFWNAWFLRKHKIPIVYDGTKSTGTTMTRIPHSSKTSTKYSLVGQLPGLLPGNLQQKP